jgi:integrase
MASVEPTATGDTAVTLSVYLADWAQTQATQVRPATWDAYRQAIRCYIAPHLGDAPLTALHVRDLNRLYAHLFARGGRHGQPLSRATVKGVHCLLHKAFEDAIDAGVMTRNPTQRATLPKVDHTQGRARSVWTIAELHAFLDHVSGHQLRDFWILAAFTGMRASELLALGWDDVDWGRLLLRVHRRLSVHRGTAELLPPKSGRGRSLHIEAFTVAALHREQHRQEQLRTASSSTWSNPANLVFTDATGRHLKPAAVSDQFRRAVRAGPVPAARQYDLRHFHATVMLQAGVPVNVVSARLGHLSAQTTLDVYAHVLPAMDADAAQRFSAFIADADGPQWR